ncbi:hypothetical protein SEA_FUZZBUSTER_84 [Microbacterium phage FuzzBuster]|uniref:Uncharacterized protein n=1 Tax=Microbacterium phage FuzzBuster TaxID=2590935 RepID=A0A516KV59_9CAUD|nr:hypothetical protein SEA_FUZZBUSTER_84 [Microbacterium phage FuzzBuster]
MSTYANAHEFARPVPYHALTPGALEAVEMMKRMGADRIVDKICAGIVTKHGNPRKVLFAGDAVTTNARKLLARAEAAGFTARLHDLGDGCMVEGYRLEPEKVGFRAWWSMSTSRTGVQSISADGASWHEPWRYEMRRDDRPIGIDQKARTGKVGYRGAGLASEHMRIVATPWGLPINHTELDARLAPYDA